MTKMIMFNVRDEELEMAKAWGEANDIELDIYSESLTLDNVERVKGYDGLSLGQTAPFDSELFPILKSYGIKQIAQRSAGVDFYDVEAATENGLILSNVPVYSPESIAEFALASALRLVRKIDRIEHRVQNFDFRWEPSIRAHVLGEMTVGIVGTGHIGKQAAQMFKGFGCEVIGYDIYPSEVDPELFTYVDSLEELVSRSDLVSLHLPATKDNYHQFDKELFKQFKEGAYLLNTARGSIINTEDLIDALDDGTLAGAALDTYENEASYIRRQNDQATIEDKLLIELVEHERVCFTPHIAFYTETAVRNLVETGLEAALEVIKTGDTKYRVN